MRDDNRDDRRREGGEEPGGGGGGEGRDPFTFWMDSLDRPENGPAYPTLANAMLIMSHDSIFTGQHAKHADERGPMFGLNTFTGQRVLLRAPPVFDKLKDERKEGEEDKAKIPGPYPRGWTDEDVSLVLGYMQQAWNRKWMRATVSEAMHAVARRHSFHPILDWLDGLVWDKTDRLDTWLVKVFGAVNEYDPIAQGDQWDARNAYHAAVGSKFMIAAVRRLRQPGCKFDHLLILEGAQRIGKSTAAAILFGAEYFSDAVPPDLRSKDAAHALHGLWCLEFAEIEHLVRTEVETIKAYLSRSTDHYRPPYARDFIDVPRANVFIGTTNADDYLRDTTGNTRMWPVACQKVDLDWITENRAQLWAEAVHRERKGETLWLDAADLQQEAARLTADRLKEDVWQAAIARWLDNTEAERVEAKERLAKGEDKKGDLFASREPIFVARVLEYAVGMSKDKMNKAAEMRVADVLKKLGWKGVQRQKLPKVKGMDGREETRITTTIWRMPDDWAAGADARKSGEPETPEDMAE